VLHVTQGSLRSGRIDWVVQQQPPPDPQSIDALAFVMAKRRLLRERVSMVFAGVFVTALVVTFYRILVS
jgi:hypothetical protein